MLLLTEQEVRTLEQALSELYGHRMDCWPPEGLDDDQVGLLKRAVDALHSLS